MKNKKILVAGYSNSIHFFRWCGFLKKAGLTVDVLSFVNNALFNYKSMADKFYDFSVKKNINSFFKILLYFFRMIRAVFLMRNSDHDYVNINFMETFLLLIILFINKKFILTCWGSDILISYRNAGGIKKIIFDAALKRSFMITCDSASVRKMIIDNCKMIDEKKIKIVFWGIDTGLFNLPGQRERNVLRKKYGIPQKSIVMLSMRNLRRMYGIDRIITWFSERFTGVSKIYLLIRIPPGSDAEYTEECKIIAGKNRHIIFNDNSIDYKRIAEIYKISDFNLHFPDSDATPVSMLEAMACGNAILCRRGIDAYREIKKLYDITIADFSELKEKKILRLYEKKEAIIKKNIKAINKYSTETITIANLRSLLHARII